MYAGALWKPNGPRFVGAVRDDIGYAVMQEIELTDSQLTFTKYYEKYGDRPDRAIHYDLKREEGTMWSGRWFWPDDQGDGLTRCVITEVDDQLFEDDLARMARRQ
jgi:hypothetical protein